MSKKNGKKKRKIKLHWASLYWKPIGNAYGYSTHNKMLLEAIRRRDDVALVPNAKVSFCLTTPNCYERFPGRYNFLYTMYETDNLPSDWIPHLAKADHLIVPCFHNKQLFERYTDLPVDVCWEGVDTTFYAYRQRHFPWDRPFRFLWVAAPNIRKGWECLIAGWQLFNQENRKVMFQQKMMGVQNPFNAFELYIKTTVTEKLKRTSDVIFDSRNLTREELRQLYYDAHAFVLPTMGEGFGLTLAEAMSTGLPCIACSNTGTADFFDSSVGYVIEDNAQEADVGGEMMNIRVPDPNSMVEQMAQCYKDYDEAKKRAHRAAQRMRERFTWDISANSLIDIIRRGVPSKEMLYQTVAGDLSPEYVTSDVNVDAVR